MVITVLFHVFLFQFAQGITHRFTYRSTRQFINKFNMFGYFISSQAFAAVGDYFFFSQAFTGFYDNKYFGRFASFRIRNAYGTGIQYLGMRIEDFVDFPAKYVKAAAYIISFPVNNVIKPSSSMVAMSPVLPAIPDGVSGFLRAQ